MATVADILHHGVLYEARFIAVPNGIPEFPDRVTFGYFVPEGPPDLKSAVFQMTREQAKELGELLCHIAQE